MNDKEICMLIFFILFILLIISIVIYCKIFFEKDNLKTYFIKIFASSIFMIIGLYSFFSLPTFEYNKLFIIIGLFMCMMGDIIIGLRRIYTNRKDLFMLIGMGLFLCAHAMYCISFTIEFKGNLVYPFIAVVGLFAGLILLLRYTKIDFGKLQIPCYVYSLSGSVLFVISLFGVILEQSIANVNLFVGIVLFIISDIFLCYTYFKKELHHVRLIKSISVVTYFIGQAMIALSIYLS